MSMPSSEVSAIWKISSNLLWALGIFLLIAASTAILDFTNELPSLSYANSLNVDNNMSILNIVN
jgi:hypothetical protein